MAPLNVKTDAYLLHSMITVKKLVQVAKENDIKALTITDNNMYNAIEFYKECKKNDIKPIIGLEIEIPEKIVLYAKSYEGYKNLIKITTIKGEKTLTINDLYSLTRDLICVVPYESRIHYNDLKKIYETIYVSYKNDEQKSKIKLTNKIYMNEILCINKEDEKYLKYLKAIKEGKTHLEVEEITNVSLLPLNNLNSEITDLCNIEIKMNQDLLPVYTKENSYELLKRECIKGMKRLFGSSAPKKYAIRLKEELQIIKQMGFCDYFLIVADYIKYAKENSILVGPGRGSAAGSLTAYTLNITTIDPLKYDLLFERFLNPERITMPDIDVDFEDTKREKVINYCIQKYGAKKVALIITFGTLASKQAIRDVARVLEIDAKKTDTLSKFLDSRKNLKENYNSGVKNFIEINPELKEVYKIASKFEGLKRHTSIHAAGVVMSKYDLEENLPLDKNNNLYVSEYDKDYLEELGLLKMDFLSIKNLTLIANILKEVKLNFDDIPEDDKEALNIFKNVNTVGIFQFESSGMINFLKKLKPDTFDDVIAALALFRPGPMKNIDSYIRRKQGKEKIDYFHEDLEKVLKPTYGIIVYQEQIMQIASIMAGYTFAEADLLRRAMSKKKEEILLKEKERFISGSIQKGYNEALATKVYDLIFKFAEYGFNKSHTVAYAMISYRMAYLKAHYPKVFMKHLLTQAINSESKTKEYIYECKKYGIEIEKPNINLSTDNYQIIGDKIVYPLTNIKNIGVSAVKEILEERQKGKFKDIFDFISRCYKGAVTVKTIESLIYSGAFDIFKINKKTLIDNIELLTNYGEIGSYLDDELFKPELDTKEEYTNHELMNYEQEVFGFYLSNHPITEYKIKNKHIDIKDIQLYFDKQIETVIYVDKIRVINTKNKETMMFITGSDELSQIDIVLFPKIYNENKNIKEGNIIKIKGKVEKRYDQYQIIANNIIILN
ncbi:MAG: DNA polymerase III subunit alpha [Bacilli bacterium]|nr:DNA polymerase III subunit alpha [Bacilli bacterium]